MSKVNYDQQRAKVLKEIYAARVKAAAEKKKADEAAAKAAESVDPIKAVL